MKVLIVHDEVWAYHNKVLISISKISDCAAKKDTQYIKKNFTMDTKSASYAA